MAANALVMQSGGSTAVLNRSLYGILGRGGFAPRLRDGLRGGPRDGGAAGPQRHAAFGTLRQQTTTDCANPRCRLGVVAPDSPGRGRPSPHGGPVGAIHQLLLHHRGQRLGGDRPRGRNERTRRRDAVDGGQRAQDYRQRPSAHRPHARLRQRGALRGYGGHGGRQGRREHGPGGADHGDRGDGSRRGVARGRLGAGQAGGARRAARRVRARGFLWTRTASWS